jgi:cytoskeletal protein CcmA (bactofilin family)
LFDKSKTASARRPAAKDSAKGSFSIIAADVTIAGTIGAGNDIQIDGVVEGDVRCVHLTIGETGRVVGAIAAEQVVVAGTVDGPIDATGVELVSTAHVSGDISYRELRIAPGAKISGKLHWVQESNLKLITNERLAE